MISQKLLSPGEEIIASTRTHWKVLILPVALLILISAADGFLVAILPDGSTHTVLTWIVVIVAVALIVWLVVWPFLNWFTARYTVTNRRLINRTGVFTRKGRDIPLQRINDVSYERGPIDRLLGCGTLVISDASETGRSVLPDVPHVEQLQLTITNLLFGVHERSDGDGTGSTAMPPAT